MGHRTYSEDSAGLSKGTEGIRERSEFKSERETG